MLQVQQLQDLQGSQLGALQRKIGSGRWKTPTGSGADRRKALRRVAEKLAQDSGSHGTTQEWSNQRIRGLSSEGDTQSYDKLEFPLAPITALITLRTSSLEYIHCLLRRQPLYEEATATETLINP